MNKIIIALGLTLAASTGAFAASTAMDAYQVPAAQTSGIDYTATAAVGAVSNDQVIYNRAGNDGSPTFLAPKGGVDYTPTASIDSVSNDKIVYDRAGNDGSPHFN
ncbi:hypothetical protein OEG84_07205 [Hoeflea sp. G2-23]|uniref:DUF680 domain-containing protein n=1 Tax=Hoeflea algicola TaxID=2983763 RepID=A0ABT3Z6V6_9HYPH|nr:hypothetical protein [Hoeflea algicola]MCY0147506.1 hypothetical protein [Hoeflea algicola]